MSKMNTLEGKRLRRIGRRIHRETSLKMFNLRLHAAFLKKYPQGREFMTDEGPVLVFAPKKPQGNVVMYRRSDVRRHVYLRKHGLPYSEKLVGLALRLVA